MIKTLALLLLIFFGFNAHAQTAANEADEEELIFSDGGETKVSISGVRIASQDGIFIINDARFETSGNPRAHQVGMIVNSRGRECIFDSPEEWFMKVQAMAPAERPIAVDGNNLLNSRGETVARIAANALQTSLRNETQRQIVFENGDTTYVLWNNKACKQKSIAEKVNFYSSCMLCPYIVMMLDMINYVFDFMYRTFQATIIAFLIVFGCLWLVWKFFGALEGWPFGHKLNDFFGSLQEKGRVIMIASVVAIIPPRTIFEFTVDPIIMLGTGIAETVLEIPDRLREKNPELNIETLNAKCNPDKIVGAISEAMEMEREAKRLPPAVERETIIPTREAKGERTKSAFLSDETAGRLICFMQDNSASLGKMLTLGEVLINPFNGGNSIALMPMGVVIFACFFLVMLWISFYVLDALISILKIAILWPFMVFGYAFDWNGMKLSTIISTAIEFATTMVSLALFAVFANLMVAVFMFGDGQTANEIIATAIAQNDARLIARAVSEGNPEKWFVAMVQFAFMAFVIFYIYSKLGSFVKEYTAGGVGEKPIGDAVKSLLKSARAMIPSGVSRKEVGYHKLGRKQEDSALSQVGRIGKRAKKLFSRKKEGEE
ncbi:MAG: hypothetical protein FWD15_02095 [Alphaproteobacteria bacterium]|nr:hypothetical protein [Alphaproteobacteria bacterium]